MTKQSVGQTIEGFHMFRRPEGSGIGKKKKKRSYPCNDIEENSIGCEGVFSMKQPEFISQLHL